MVDVKLFLECYDVPRTLCCSLLLLMLYSQLGSLVSQKDALQLGVPLVQLLCQRSPHSLRKTYTFMQGCGK
jgi:hypothetical protein